jgi:hypothetical protein
MADTTRTITGFGEFHYDQVVYDELMSLSKAELVKRELDGTTFQRTAVRGLKKVDVAVLVAHRETARREWDANSVEVEATADQDADAELISFMRTVVAAPSLPEALSITETDVSAAEVYVVVQLGKRLYDGTLISVVNRRTTFSPAFLVTVELADGVRRLVRADHTLAA